MKKLLLSLAAALCALSTMAQGDSINVQRIWGDGTRHCAFTSLVKYKGTYFCAFREGRGHIFNDEGEADGKVRVITSTDGRQWRSTALLSEDGCDLRDPKLSVTPDGRLMLLMGRSIYKNKELQSTTSLVSFSRDGRKFTRPKAAKMTSGHVHSREWLWRVTWHEGKGYGVSYWRDLSTDGQGGEHLGLSGLLSTDNGIKYSLVSEFSVPGEANESTVRFAPDGRAYVFVRRDGEPSSALLLTAPAPYHDWQTYDLGFYCGGPDALVLADGCILLSGRSYSTGQAKTAVWTGDGLGHFKEIVTLPSGGDCSYPSLLQVGDEVWISYYSSHEADRPSIYLARLPLKLF